MPRCSIGLIPCFHATRCDRRIAFRGQDGVLIDRERLRFISSFHERDGKRRRIWPHFKQQANRSGTDQLTFVGREIDRLKFA